MSSSHFKPSPKVRESNPCSGLTLDKSAIIVLVAFVICSIDLLNPPVAGAEKLTPVINTTTGPVRGEILTTVVKNLTYSSFRGIRYAEPPSGYRRFKPPIPVKPWTDVLNAVVEASACPQINLITNNYTGNEDCLFVNVFTPLTNFGEKDERGKAVMVWMYGGSFVSGNAKTTLYGPDFLIEDDVILVTFNYRVGPLGFLSLDHPNATGNAGLKDQVLALKWVNENIEKFGGDSGRITIFGNSAGGASVDLHTLSEGSAGLFHRAISISASLFIPLALHTPEQAANQGFALGSQLGINTTSTNELLQRLYEATLIEIAEAAHRMNLIESVPFRPTAEDPNIAGDDAFMTENPVNKYRRGNFTKVPYITGFTAQEAAYLFGDETVEPIAELVSSVMATLDQINQSLPLTTPKLRNLISTAQNAVTQIPNATLSELIRTTTFKHFTSGVDVKQRFLNDQSPEPVYYYQVTFNPSKSLHELLYHQVYNGSVHADDLAYMFYIPLVDLPLDEADSISITRRRVVRLWTNFAKYGNPTPDGEADPIVRLTWPASGSTGVHLDIGEELSVRPRPVDASDNYLKFLEEQPWSSRSGARSVH